MTTSYIAHTFRATERVRNYVNKLTEGLTQESRHLFLHVLLGMQVNLKRRNCEGWVPVPAATMRKQWGNRANIQIEEMEARGLLEVRVLDEIYLPDGEFIKITYDKAAGLCREFRVTLDVLDKIVANYPGNLKQYANGKYYNLITDKPMGKFKRHKLTNETGHPIPSLVKNSMLAVKSCVVNHVNIDRFFYERKNEIDNIKLIYPEDSSLQKLRRRYHHNKGCINKVFSMSDGGKILGDGLMEYYPSYEIQYSGRITEVGGGLQSASRELKKAAFSGIPNVYNYDLKSSQVYGLIQWFELAKLDRTWLHQYLNRAKKEYADYVEVSVDCWKSLFLSLIMAAHLPSPDKVGKFTELKEFEDSTDSLLRYISEEATSLEDTVNKYTRFYNLVKPLKVQLDKWHNWLLKEYVPVNSTYPQGKQYVSNKTGATFCISEYRKPDGKWKNILELKRKLAPFYLQGNEAAFIHHLTWVSEHYGYSVISNQHDGVVTLGKVPQEAIDHAREASGLKYAQLELKDFC